MKSIPSLEFAEKYWAAIAEIEKRHARAGHPFQRVKNTEIAHLLGLGKTAFYDYVKNGPPPRPRLLTRPSDDDDEIEETG